jgi:hypothetical protein
MSAQTVATKHIPPKRQISFFKSAIPGFSEFPVFQEIASEDSETIVRPNKRLAHGRASKIGQIMITNYMIRNDEIPPRIFISLARIEPATSVLTMNYFKEFYLSVI